MSHRFRVAVTLAFVLVAAAAGVLAPPLSAPVGAQDDPGGSNETIPCQINEIKAALPTTNGRTIGVCLPTGLITFKFDPSRCPPDTTAVLPRDNPDVANGDRYTYDLRAEATNGNISAEKFLELRGSCLNGVGYATKVGSIFYRHTNPGNVVLDPDRPENQNRLHWVDANGRRVSANSSSAVAGYSPGCAPPPGPDGVSPCLPR